MQEENYFVKSEQIKGEGNTMVVLDVCLDNFYAFKNFHMNLTYPKKIVGSSIKEEHLAGRPNFRYKKVNIIMGANASGKTTLGYMLMSIFNFLEKENYNSITRAVGDSKKKASFTLDMASGTNVFYRVACAVTPRKGEVYTPRDIRLEIRKESILPGDSYESCVKRIEAAAYSPEESYLDELDKIEALDWMFVYPGDTGHVLRLPDKNEIFRSVLENILKSLDPAIRRVEMSRDVEKAYVIRLQDRSIILQNGEQFDTKLLSSGTKAGVEVARVVSSLIQDLRTFYYCDEKFPYIHSDIEKALLSLMIEYVRPNAQLFFTTHNTDILDMSLPKHAFTFLRKDAEDAEHPITCVSASALLKRSTDSLRHAVENDLFACAPAVDRIYAIENS